MGRMSEGESMNGSGKKVFGRLLYFLLLVVFICSVLGILHYGLEERRQERSQEEAVENYIREAPEPEILSENGNETVQEISGESEGENEQEVCPITVNFDALLAENEDIAGWLYCEDTKIHYPVVQGKDNDYYLHHGWDRKESRAGALFVDAENRTGFADSNTIIYGHHMRNGSMFAHLGDFAKQEYFDAHPVMWLLTPERTYRVELIGGYLTSADSDSYTIFTGPCAELEQYLEVAAAASDVRSDVETPKDGRYVMFSTCEYDFEDARYVLHGRLVPVGEDAQEEE